MARPNSKDPLETFPVRLPASLVDRFRAESKASGRTHSDVLRSYITLEQAKPLNKAIPRKRPASLGKVSGTDPKLLRQLVAIGNNLNQIARGKNATGNVASIELLIVLRSIEQQLSKIADLKGAEDAH